MKRRIMTILTLSFLICGCSHTIMQYGNEQDDIFYARVEKICENKNDLLIGTIDKKEYNARELKVTKDSTSFVENKNNQKIVKRTKDIVSVSFAETERGAFDGLLYGSLIGGSVGLLAQLKSVGGAAPKGDVYFIFYSAAAGAALGTAYGLINPGTITIKFN